MSSTQGEGAGGRIGEPAGQAPAAAPKGPAPLAAPKPAAAPQPAAPASQPDASATAGSGQLLRKAANKLPFRWLTIAISGVALVATAGFGGLNIVEQPGAVELAAGETFEGQLASITIERGVLIDDFGEGGAWVDEGSSERVLVIVLTAEDVWSQWIATGSSLAPFWKTFSIDGMPELEIEGFALFADGTLAPVLQPGIPSQLTMSYIVPADLLAEGDEVRIALTDQSVARGQDIVYGDYWTLDEEPSAFVTVEVTDVGAGANAEGGS